MSADPNETVECYCRNWNGAVPYARATIVRTEGPASAKAGSKAIVTAEGELIGWLGGGCLRGAVLRAAQEAIRTGTPKLIRVRPEEQVHHSQDEDGVELHTSSCPSKGSSEIFIEPVLPKPVLVVIGASFVAAALSEVAPLLGFGLVHVAAVRGSNAALALSELPNQPGLERAFIAVATQGAGDYAALSAAMATPAPYIAFVSSPAKAQDMRERLIKDGFNATALERLSAPAGLDIGSETPAEIAVAILAEIVSLRRTKVNRNER
jgi:xanthine dehydrogenase accessory factor